MASATTSTPVKLPSVPPYVSLKLWQEPLSFEWYFAYKVSVFVHRKHTKKTLYLYKPIISMVKFTDEPSSKVLEETVKTMDKQAWRWLDAGKYQEEEYDPKTDSYKFVKVREFNEYKLMRPSNATLR